MPETSYPASQARSYLYFRIFIGGIGIAFPFVLLVGHWLLEGGILNAISDYNYSASMRNIFVGGLVALGMLLVAYQYSHVDNVVTTIAGLCAMGVAFFPEAPPFDPSHGQQVVGIFHLVFAASFFIILAFITFFLFTKPAVPFTHVRLALAHLLRWTPLASRLRPSDAQLPSALPTRKRQRNRIYRVCGGTIVACLALLLLLLFVRVPPQIAALHPVYWLETLAVVAFGAAWIVKGALLLRDEGSAPDPVQRAVARVTRVVRPIKVMPNPRAADVVGCADA